MAKMTGTVRERVELDSEPILKPENGEKGYWTPDDQETTKMTPMLVTFMNGVWYSIMAYRMLLNEKMNLFDSIIRNPSKK